MGHTKALGIHVGAIVALVVLLVACVDEADGGPEVQADGSSVVGAALEASSVDEVLAALPSEMREHAVLMTSTGCNHRADVDHPRTLFFRPDGRLVVAASTDPSDPDYETMHLAELTGEGTWELSAIDLGGAEPRVETNPSACASCHGSPAHPRWDEFPTWAGAAGDEAGRISDEERQALVAAFADPAHRLRFAEVTLDAERSTLRLGRRFYDAPNTVFTQELGTAVAEGVATRLRTSPEYGWLPRAWTLADQCAAVDDAAVAEALEEVDARLDPELPRREGLYLLGGVDPDQLALSDAGLDANVGGETLHGLVSFLVLADAVDATPAIGEALADVDERREQMLADWWGPHSVERAWVFAEGSEERLAPTELTDEALGDELDPRRVAFCRALAR